MEFSYDEPDRVAPFNYGSNRPAKAIFIRALSLTAGRDIVASYVERLDEKEGVTSTVWLLFANSIARVHGVGRRSPDHPRADQPEEVTAEEWPLRTVSQFSIGDVQEYEEDFSPGLTWSAQIRLDLGPMPLLIPSRESFPPPSQQRGTLDAFTAALAQALDRQPGGSAD